MNTPADGLFLYILCHDFPRADLDDLFTKRYNMVKITPRVAMELKQYNFVRGDKLFSSEKMSVAS